ncbi:MAG: GGDEF domain-containing protein [Oscillospiraceae bacterium]|nr:GGDEF domain-containing protein [Oscillospiraceae bacterium]
MYSVLIQVFSSNDDKYEMMEITGMLESFFTKAIIVGTTTSGEISDSVTYNNKIAVSISYFKKTELSLFYSEYKDDEEKMGSELANAIKDTGKEISGIMLLASIRNINGGLMLSSFEKVIGNVLVFGAGAGVYNNSRNSFVFCSGKILEYGVTAVVFTSQCLKIQIHTYTGWQPLSKEMKITSISNPLKIKEIDYQPAVHIYQKYLHIKNDEYFFSNVLEFPIFVNRKGNMLARVPVGCEDESLLFVADVREGDLIQLAYGNVENIIKCSNNLRKKMSEMKPESIFLYSCNIRQIFLGPNIQNETQPLGKIAPVSGFFTYGEIIGDSSGINLLNATMIAVAMKEEDTDIPVNEDNSVINEDKEIDWNTGGSISLVTRLSYFINSVLEESQENFIKLQIMAETDQLTNVYNRRKTTEYIDNAIANADCNHVPALIMADIDYFKHINDSYGHDIGDIILKEFTDILKKYSDKGVVGRWGGEEFMIVFMDSENLKLVELCENIRHNVEMYRFTCNAKVTASFGIVHFKNGYTRSDFCKQVDDCLYKAKSTGRNRVCTVNDL